MKSWVDRVGDTGFVRIAAPSFASLDSRHRALAYWLTQASIAIDPIAYDQLSAYGLRQKRLLEEIVAHPQDIDNEVLRKITDFAKLFWANRGNHNDETAQKFLPNFTFDELKHAALTAQSKGAMKTAYGDLPPLKTAAELNHELDDVRASLFDPNFEPMVTAKSPAGGKDIIQASSNNFYQGVTLAELKALHESHPLNSRVVKKNGQLYEEVYRAGTPDGKLPPGLYATYLRRANAYLAKARGYADPAQSQVIADLIKYFQTGDFNDWLRFDADWVRNNEPVDFSNGFVEVYRDARGRKGTAASFVSVTDQPVTETAVKLAQNAEYFEQKAPWDAKYKKRNFQPPLIKAIETLIETGDFSAITIGDNLPNENQIHEKYGTKNFIFTSSIRALNEAQGTKIAEEFSATQEEIERNKEFGEQADDLHTEMHEVIGHGSGQLSPRLQGGAEPYLKEYFSTLEEARADLMALWNAWDPKLRELALVAHQEEVARAMYDSQVRIALTQLRRVPKGDTLEEDHARNRQLIVNYIVDKNGAIQKIEKNGKTYYQVVDYQKMRQAVGALLAELMRIKAEGDYPAIKALVDKYAVHFDPALRDQVVARYKELDLPTYWAGVNAILRAQSTPNGRINTVEISYPRDPVQQYLSYGAMYDEGLEPSVHAGSRLNHPIPSWPKHGRALN